MDIYDVCRYATEVMALRAPVHVYTHAAVMTWHTDANSHKGVDWGLDLKGSFLMWRPPHMFEPDTEWW